jgi:REP element-mobilizing transposase RayT
MLEYRRRLPHFQPDGVPIFLTWRLYGSLPLHRLGELLVSQPTAGRAFVVADRELDRGGHGPRWLTDPRISRIVADAILAGEAERGFYKIHAWAIMPNHVHLLILPKVPVPTLARWLKGSTARSANRILGRTGQTFWQDESWDHWVRDSHQLHRLVRYIEENPVTAGLVSSAELWLGSSAFVAGETASTCVPATLVRG